MLIQPVYSFSFKSEENLNLKPIKEHQGPTLQLTAEEQKRIDAYQREINEYEESMYKLQTAMDRVKRNGNLIKYYWLKSCDISTSISHLQNQIRKIKINRFAIQMEEYLKKSAKK